MVHRYRWFSRFSLPTDSKLNIALKYLMEKKRLHALLTCYTVSLLSFVVFALMPPVLTHFELIMSPVLTHFETGIRAGRDASASEIR